VKQMTSTTGVESSTHLICTCEDGAKWYDLYENRFLLTHVTLLEEFPTLQQQ